ncbi:unnamed protein product [Caenorhabditis bovis]|uniref:Uncharacterized protein n=1 Tax=Caenorhabditis bovis TaxID=2654633 RepID=A0A8S1F923_9PELO|nr:unnamed protein product [Caenorhabditis bovis]
MRFFILFACFVAAILAQGLPCGFSCTRRAVINTIIDGVRGTASCSDNTTPARCENCCKGRALQANLESNFAAGFVSNDGRTCVCCFNNQCFNTFSSGRK